MVRPRVYFDFSVDGAPIGRVTFELFNDTAPRTAENFRALCTGEKGISHISDRPLYYKNSIIHRSIPDFILQGGDFTKQNGSGGESIYGAPFLDEDLTHPLDSEGLLCMANKGPSTNGSQFFITLKECPHLNGKHVVFGRVIGGYDDVVKRISEVPADGKDRPKVPVTISNCGELELRKKQDNMHQASVKRSKKLSDDEDAQNTIGRRRKHRSDDPEDRSKRHRKKSKHKKDQSSTLEDGPAQDTVVKGPVAETEEEYDARLEREEHERREAERKKELERIRTQYTDAAQSTDGVRFKGRGRMKFVDPEVHRRRHH